MKRRVIPPLAALLLVWGSLSGPCFALSGLEWKIAGQLHLQAPPLDVAASADGRWILILTAGEVLAYSLDQGRIIDRVPVDPTFDKLTYSSKDDLVILTSSSSKSLEMIQLDVVYDLSVSGLPFRGPPNAPVTLAVFEDYQ